MFSTHQYNSYLPFKDVEEDHDLFTERLRKTLYYGKVPGTDRPSFPLTDMAVNFYQEVAPRQLGKLDHYVAASTSRAACLSASSMIVGMMYVKRLKKKQPYYLTQISSSELFLVSMMMASKFLYDEGVDDEVFNDEWALSGEMDVEDVNQLERDFLTAIDWQLFVRPEDFADILNQVEKRIARQQGFDRGWFSYTDLFLLSQSFKFMNWNDLVRELSKVFSVLSIAYIAGIVTLIGSVRLGTSASNTLVDFGSSVLPLDYNLPLFMMASNKELMPASSQSIDFESTDLLVNNGSDLVGLHEHIHEQKLVLDLQENPIDNSVCHIDTDDDDDNGSLKTRPKEQKNGILQSLLALLALKSTLFQYAFEHDDSHCHEYIDHAFDPHVEHSCSDGPCLVDSWPGCWNMSSERDDWTAPQHLTLTGSCCEQCTRYGHVNCRNEHNFVCGHDASTLDWVQCCCKISKADGMSCKTSHMNGILRKLSWVKTTFITFMDPNSRRLPIPSLFPGLITR